ncbi:phytoene desaturase family protein [Coprothermobacter platensis]|uniref:phytoene desaturase family protein n=1 Tax=Coprothermobacter platensis TaxID=108819 RepID=UPI000371D328|nr:NAD(P)/FAD-dependent oxidoreductase [Coprothermobacter platensis]
MKNNEPSKFDAIIVGGGIAGLTAASYLCRYGHNTLLLEKSKNVGGLVGSFEKDGFIFDFGARAFENSGIILPMLKQLGIDMEFLGNPVTIGIGDEFVEISSQESLHDYGNMLKRLFPQNGSDIDRIMQEIDKTMSYMDVMYGIDNPLFSDLNNDTQYLLHTLLPWLLKYRKNLKQIKKLNEPVDEYLMKFTDNRQLVDMITQHFFRKTPTFFALSYFGLYMEYFYPKGGTGVLPRALSSYIETHGGKVLVDSAVTKIDLDHKSVITGDGKEFSYEELIWACDQKTLYNVLETNDQRLRKKISENRELLNGCHGSDSVLTVFLALDMDKEYFRKRCGAHLFYTPNTNGLSSFVNPIQAHPNPNTPKEMIMQWIIDYFKHTTYEISCPALRDSSLAPQGNTGLIVSSLIDYDIAKVAASQGWYSEFKEQCERAILDTLDSSVFPGIKTKVLFSSCSTPLSIERITGNFEGAITGWAFTNTFLPCETNLDKISKAVFTPFRNLYQAGQWTFGPSGIPTCILTGKLAADDVHKKLNKRH